MVRPVPIRPVPIRPVAIRTFPSGSTETIDSWTRELIAVSAKFFAARVRTPDASERPTLASVASALRAEVDGLDDPLNAIVDGLEYYPIEGCEHVLLAEHQRPRNCTCAPAGAPVDARVSAMWARALAYAPHPLVAARFADLLWSARAGDSPHEWAQRAIDAYLAAVYDEFGHPLEIAEGLQRALGVAIEIDDHPRIAATVAALVGLADRSLASVERSSGVVLSIVESLADRSSAARPGELQGLVDRALDRYRHDAWLLESTLDVKARLVEPCERAQLRVDQIDAFADLARRSSGSLRYAHYEHAIQLAVEHNLPDRAEQLRAELDGPPFDGSEPPADTFEPVIDLTETEDARAAVDEFVDRIVGADTLNESLARFGASLPTEGFSGAVEAAEVERLEFFGVLAVDLLTRARERYGPVSAAGAWFECPLIGPTIASRLAHGFELFELGDFDGSASVLAPRLEWIVRSVASAAGVVDVGSDLTIDDVFVALEGALYEPSRRYLRELLPRNAASTTARDAALLVHAACHLRLLQPVEAPGLLA